MYCEHCGYCLENGGLFCPNCGNPVNESENTKKKITTGKVKRGNAGIKILVILSVLVFLCVSAFFAYALFIHKADEAEQNRIKSIGAMKVTESHVLEHIVDAKITASSVLYEEGYSYNLENLIDQDPSTCWSEGATGNGIGESVTYDFKGGVRSVRGLAIMPGFHKSEDLLKKNGKPVSISIEGICPGQPRQEFTYTLPGTSDIGEMIYLDFGGAIDMTECTVTIEEVREGSKFDDCCISEMYFFE